MYYTVFTEKLVTIAKTLSPGNWHTFIVHIQNHYCNKEEVIQCVESMQTIFSPNFIARSFWNSVWIQSNMSSFAMLSTSSACSVPAFYTIGQDCTVDLTFPVPKYRPLMIILMVLYPLYIANCSPKLYPVATLSFVTKKDR